MKKFSFKAVALAAGVLAGGSAFAAVNLDTNSGAGAAIKFAKELNISGAGTALTNAGNALDIVADAGVAVAASTTRYVRIDLSSGVFTATPTLSVAASGGTAATLTGTLTSGGTGSAFAVFSVATGTAAIVAADDVTVGVTTGITATSQSTITARYRIFGIPAFADAPTETNALYSKTGNLITFDNALKFEVTTNNELTADYGASTPFAAFTTSTDQTLGTITVTESLANKADGTAATFANIVQDKTVVTVNGDFTFLKKTADTPPVLDKQFLTLGAAATATTVTDTKATFGTSADGWESVAAGAKNLIIEASNGLSGTTPIPVGAYTVDFAFTAQTGYTAPTVTGLKVGSIKRNGTTLVAPLAQVPAGWKSRLVLTNSGNNPLAYRVTAAGETGATVTLSGAAASGTVAANKTLVIDLDQTNLTVVGGNGARSGLVVTVDGADTAISGQYQLLNTATGSVSNSPLVKK